jgi:hypothetical protein
LEADRHTTGLWIVGGEERGKTALCGYLAQRLSPLELATVERLGDLLAELRWLAASGGQADLEQRLNALTTAPLLVLDDFDRPVRSHHPGSLVFAASCTRHDLLTLARILRERSDALLPTVVTSRSMPDDCLERIAAIQRVDLVRGLIATASNQADPIEDFPDYPMKLLSSSIQGLLACSTLCQIDGEGLAAMAA